MSQLPKNWKDGLKIVYREAFAPTPAPALWDWATDKVVLPSSETSTLGHFSATRAAPFRRIHGIIAARKMGRAVTSTDPHAWQAEQLWVVWSAQCGKTVSTAFAAFSWMSRYYPHQPSGFFWPTMDLKKAQMRDRLEPLWQATPDLADLMPTPGTEEYTRRIGNRTWRLANGLRAGMRVGGIANDLKANPYANITFDEFDALKQNVGGEGDPIALAEGRQRTFGPQSFMLGVTTPSTVEGHGWKRLCSGSHERLMVRCPACDHRDWPNPDNLRAVIAEGSEELPSAQDMARHDLAVWCCKCGVQHRTDAFRAMVSEAIERDEWSAGTFVVDEDHPRGIWIPAIPLDDQGRWKGDVWPVVDSSIRSVHGNILITDVWTLGKFLSQEMIALAGTDDDRQTHWNTARAEPYFPRFTDAATMDERAAVVDATQPHGIIPAGAKWLLLMLDQQGNTERLAWFPWVLRAIGPGGESWLVDAGQVPKPGEDEVGGFAGVDLLAERAWKRADGMDDMKPNLVIMDGANGTMAEKVRAWAARQPQRRVLIWGNHRLTSEEPFRLYVPGKRAKQPWPQGVRGYAIASNYWRDRVDERRRQVIGAPGWWLPDAVPAYYLRSVWDSEVRVVVQRQVTGLGMREVVAWEPSKSTDGKTVTYRRDNHWWDCEVGLAAIANIFGLDKTIAPSTHQRVRRRVGSIRGKE